MRVSPIEGKDLESRSLPTALLLLDPNALHLGRSFVMTSNGCGSPKLVELIRRPTVLCPCLNWQEHSPSDAPGTLDAVAIAASGSTAAGHRMLGRRTGPAGKRPQNAVRKSDQAVREHSAVGDA